MLETTPHLTSPNKALERSIAKTHPGQASWALVGEGIRDTCRECAFWWKQDRPYYAKSGARGQTLKPGSCKKYSNLMNGRKGANVPHNALVCKFFDPNDQPPSITKPKEFQ